ncbi:MAG: hypothetical protein ABEK59_11960, partial [Halobacteria archaeon]
LTIDTILANQYRNNPASFSELRPSVYANANRLTSMALAVQQFKMRNLAFKKPVENMLHFAQEQIRTGRMGDPALPNGKLSRIQSRFDHFSMSLS